MTEYSSARCVRPSPRLRSVRAEHPLEAFVRIGIAEGYDVDRTSDDEVHLLVPGFWCDHDVAVSWNVVTETLHVFVVFEGRVPGGRSDDMCRLLALLNERLEVGHFDFWSCTTALVYRASHSLAGGAKLALEQAMALICGAVDASERGYPAFQYVVWAGKSPEDAIDSAALDLAAQG